MSGIEGMLEVKPEIQETFAWEEHPVYGRLRVIVRQVIRDGTPSGAPISFFDLDYQPPLPEGAVRGNPRNCAPFCNHCNPPTYFYLDQALDCVQCEQAFVFTAKEQKQWFEEMKVHIRTRCLRCPACRARRHSKRVLQRNLSEAMTDFEKEPDNELINLLVARSLVEHILGTGEGNIEKAIHHARLGRARSALHPESWFWEAKAHQLAGRKEKCLECFSRFLSLAAEAIYLTEMLQEAKSFCARAETLPGD